jgi:hypothetical protein
MTENYTEPKQKRTRRKPYVNGIDFHNALVEWKEDLKCDSTARMSNYIGECFTKIATQRAKHGWFSGYSFKDEMIGEAVLTMCKYAKNYDPEKTDNGFAYFTQFANNAFFQVMKREKNFADYKFEMVKMTQTGSEGFDYNNFFNDEEA